MELPIPAIVDQLDVPTVIAILLIGGYKIIRKLDAMIGGIASMQHEQKRVANELAQHKDHDRADFKAVHQRLDKILDVHR